MSILNIVWIGTKPCPITETASAWLDLLRAFLLAEVILGHLAAVANIPEIPQLTSYEGGYAAFVLIYRLTTRFGPQSAFLFVFLSGYFVGGPVLEQAINKQISPFAEFVRRRFTRIAPALWLSLMLGCAFDLISVYVYGASETFAKQKSYNFLESMSPINLIGNFFCLQPTFVSTFGSNGPLWTLGYIVQFYIAGFFICLLLARRAYVELLGVTLVFAAILYQRPEWAVLFVNWALGAAIRNISLGPFAERYGLLIGFVVFVVANRMPPLLSMLQCGIGGVFLLSWIRANSHQIPSFIQRTSASLASVSYEAYMIHYPAAMLFFVAYIERQPDTTFSYLSCIALSLTFIGVCTLVTASASKLIASTILRNS